MQIENSVVEYLKQITKMHKPNECCCLLFKNNTAVVDVTDYAESLSPGHFGEIDPEIVNYLIETYGIPSAIFHSHPCEAFVSPTDLKYMIPTISFWDCIWLIMSDKFEIKAFTLEKFKNTIGSIELEVEIIE